VNAQIGFMSSMQNTLSSMGGHGYTTQGRGDTQGGLAASVDNSSIDQSQLDAKLGDHSKLPSRDNTNQVASIQSDHISAIESNKFTGAN